MGRIQAKPDLYERIVELVSRHMFDDNDRSVLLDAAIALMPANLRLIRQVEAYAGQAVLVSDVVRALGLKHSQSVVVGKALAQLGYHRKMIRLDSVVYPVWLKNCRNPKLALWEILREKEPTRVEPESIGEAGQEFEVPTYC